MYFGFLVVKLHHTLEMRAGKSFLPGALRAPLRFLAFGEGQPTATFSTLAIGLRKVAVETGPWMRSSWPITR